MAFTPSQPMSTADQHQVSTSDRAGDCTLWRPAAEMLLDAVEPRRVPPHDQVALADAAENELRDQLADPHRRERDERLAHARRRVEEARGLHAARPLDVE